MPDQFLALYGLSVDESDPQQRYYAVVTALDEAIGRVLAALDAAGATGNTFVFFYSDNGAFRLGRTGLDVGSNFPLRHGGVTCWEGGLRVAALARWPGQIRPGSVINQPLWSPDLLTACAKISGAPLPADRVLDGKNPLPVLVNNAPSPHESFLVRYGKHAALRKGDWKIVRERPDQVWQLFNLADDLAEARNLAHDQPGRVADLEATFLNWEE